MKKILTLLLPLFLLYGCSVKNIKTAPSKTQSAVFNESFNDTWKAVVISLAELGMPIKTMNKDNGFINTGFVLFKNKKEFASSALCRPLKWTSPDTEPVSPNTEPVPPITSERFTLSIMVSEFEMEEKTSVTVVPYIEGINDISGASERCSSSGEIERKLFLLISRNFSSDDTLRIRNEIETGRGKQNTSLSKIKAKLKLGNIKDRNKERKIIRQLEENLMPVLK